MIPSWSDAMHEAITADGTYEARLSTGDIITFRRMDAPASKTTPQYVDLIDAWRSESQTTPIPRFAVRASAILTLHRFK